MSLNVRTLLLKTFCLYLESCGTRNDLNELSGNDSLPGSVEGNGQLVNHFTWKEKYQYANIHQIFFARTKFAVLLQLNWNFVALELYSIAYGMDKF